MLLPPGHAKVKERDQRSPPKQKAIHMRSGPATAQFIPTASTFASASPRATMLTGSDESSLTPISPGGGGIFDRNGSKKR